MRISECLELEMQATHKLDEEGLGYSSYGSEEEGGDEGDPTHGTREVR